VKSAGLNSKESGNALSIGKGFRVCCILARKLFYPGRSAIPCCTGYRLEIPRDSQLREKIVEEHDLDRW